MTYRGDKMVIVTGGPESSAPTSHKGLRPWEPHRGLLIRLGVVAVVPGQLHRPGQLCRLPAACARVLERGSLVCDSSCG
jgi:hypothetical protein